MGAETWDDPYGILPQQFREEYGACETVADALERAERQPSTTDPDDLSRCPECGSTQIKHKVARDDSDRQPGSWRCTCCWTHFDDPAYGMIPKQNRGTTFSWIDDDDLADPDERTALQPPLAELDEQTRTALALVLYRPWTEEGPSYREIAPYFPNSHYWVGRRVRAWRDGEYRDLVPDPTSDDEIGDATTVDDAPAATATATDGGRERRRRRWSAFGG